MKYRLRTLLILLALMPPILSVIYVRWQRYRERQRVLEIIRSIDLADQYSSPAIWQAISRLSPPPQPPPDAVSSDANEENP